MTKAMTNGLHHVGLAVPDIEATRAFFCDALGYETVGGLSDYPAHFISDGSSLITLWQVGDPANAVSFDRKRNIGLHHLAIAVQDDAALNMLFERISAWPDAEIEFDPCPMGEGSDVRHFICAVPGGVRVEFATPFS